MPYSIKTWDETTRDLDATFNKWGIDNWLTIPARPGRGRVQDEGERRVAVWFELRGNDMRLECSQHPSRPENLRALYNTIEAYRLMEARGTAGLMTELLKQLPAPAPLAGSAAQYTTEGPYSVLGVLPSASLAVAEASYRTLMREAHPDRPGGSQERAARLNAAIETIRKERSSDV